MLEPAFAPLLPSLLLTVYIAFVAGAGALANCAVIAALLKRSNIGMFSIIIQLSLADILLLVTCGPELWSYNIGTWDFGNNGCRIYKGLSIFASTASLYLVITISLHTLATVNLHHRISVRKNKVSIGNEEEETRSSCHSLVANSDSSTPPRTMNVDNIMMRVTKIPVTPPTVFVWILSASLSIPQFLLSSTVQRGSSYVFCDLLDSTHKIYIHTLLAFFELFLPLIVLSLVFVVIVLKLKSSCSFPQIGSADYVPSLKLSLCLTIAYIVMCAPRAVYVVYQSLFSKKNVQLKDQDENSFIRLALSAVFLASTLIRPILCMLLIPEINKKY